MKTRPTVHTIIELLAVLSSAGALGLGCSKAPPASEVPASPGAQPEAAEASCTADKGNCGGHAPGDDSCGAAAGDGDAPEAAALAAASGTEHSWTVAPGKFAEINLAMGADSSVTAEFAIEGGDMAWNVHSHVDHKSVTHAEGRSSTGNVPFAPDAEGLYSYLWANDGKADLKITVRLSAEGDVMIHSTVPAR